MPDSGVGKRLGLTEVDEMSLGGGRVTRSDCTAEQALAVEKFSTSKSLKINAFAGTGKTTTLRVMGEATQRKGLYLAFNRPWPIMRPAFPSNVECRTIHSLAFRQMRNEFKSEEKLIGATNRNQVASLLSVQIFRSALSLSLIDRLPVWSWRRESVHA